MDRYLMSLASGLRGARIVSMVDIATISQNGSWSMFSVL